MARKDTLKALKAYAFGDPVAGDDLDMSAELAGQSDRAAFILVAARLDNALALALQNLFRRDLSADDKKGLFDFQGPAGSSSARVKLAYALRVIDRHERAFFDVLRDIRNVCAHSPRRFHFSTQRWRQQPSSYSPTGHFLRMSGRVWQSFGAALRWRKNSSRGSRRTWSC